MHYFPEEVRAERGVSGEKDDLREVTFENFEDICVDKSGFCMLAFLPSITQIDYERENHQ